MRTVVAFAGLTALATLALVATMSAVYVAGKVSYIVSFVDSLS